MNGHTKLTFVDAATLLLLSFGTNEEFCVTQSMLAEHRGVYTPEALWKNVSVPIVLTPMRNMTFIITSVK
jgi:hypothetical protein